MKKVSRILALVTGPCLGVLIALAFHKVLSGQFTWSERRAPLVAALEICALLLIANAMATFKRSHQQGYGLVQIAIGVVIILSQLGDSVPSSDPRHTVFIVEVLVALFFFSEGIENFTAERKGVKDHSAGDGTSAEKANRA